MSKRDIASSGNNEWETPPEIFQHWNKIFDFECDVAASHDNYKVKTYYTKALDATQIEWHSRNWMNPPYGRGMIKQFLFKAYKEAKLYNRLTVGLLPVATSTKWWQEYVTEADYVYFYPHRINFLRNGLVVKGGAFDPCIVIWGLNP